MTNTILIPSDFANEILRRDPMTADWLAQIPNLFADIRQQWNLTQNGTPMFGRTAIVIPVTRGNTSAALKLVSPVGDAYAEARTLTLMQGTAIVPLLKVSIAHGALLLDRLENESLKVHCSPLEAVSIAGSIAASIGTTPAPADAPQMSTGALGWLNGIREQHAHAGSCGLSVAEEQFELAQDVIQQLAEHASPTMTHGDLSIDNILRAASGEWVAIDPYFQAGPTSNEAHTVVRGYLPEIFESDSPLEMLHELTGHFCDAAGLDYLEAHRLSFARYVASYYWEAQNGGDAANIDRLHKATVSTYEIIQRY